MSRATAKVSGGRAESAIRTERAAPALVESRGASGRTAPAAAATGRGPKGRLRLVGATTDGASPVAEVELPKPRAKRATRPVAAPAKLVAGRTALSSNPGATLASKAKAAADANGYARRPMEEIWAEYKANPSRPLKNYITEKYLEIVRYTAERMHKKLPSEVELDDLISAGVFGLMDAIDAFDLGRGVKFETFCSQRISGAVLDHLRAMDWVPRLVRSRTAKVDKVRRKIEMETGQKATDAEIASRMGVDPTEFTKLGRDSRPVGVVSLSRKWFETDSSKDVREIDVIRDNRQQNPVQLVQRQDLQTLITKGLSRAERLIVILYYYEEMTMKEIGMTLDLSESRVSQLHSQILDRLKSHMHYREREF